jgi:hypothetical protein
VPNDETWYGPASVGAEQILAVHGVLATGRVVADVAAHAVVVLRQADELVPKSNATGRQFFGARFQQRLEPDLGQVQLTPRARRAPELVGATRAPRFEAHQRVAVIRFGPCESRVERGGRHLRGRRAALGDCVSDANVVEDLHRAQVQYVGFGQVRCLGPGAHQEVIDAEARQVHGGREARAPATNDQNGIGFVHPASLIV